MIMRYDIIRPQPDDVQNYTMLPLQQCKQQEEGVCEQPSHPRLD